MMYWSWVKQTIKEHACQVYSVPDQMYVGGINALTETMPQHYTSSLQPSIKYNTLSYL